MSTEPEFRVAELLAALTDNDVDYIVIGAVAARMQGSSVVTRDLDVCHARDQRNLEALAAALHGIHAQLRGAPAGLPFRLDAKSLRAGDSFTFTTDAGDLDVLGTPSGTDGYEDLVRSADKVDIEGMTVLAASIEDLMRMKRAAGRPKDLMQLELLAALLEEVEDQARRKRREPGDEE